MSTKMRELGSVVEHDGRLYEIVERGESGAVRVAKSVGKNVGIGVLGVGIFGFCVGRAAVKEVTGTFRRGYSDTKAIIRMKKEARDA